MNSVSFPAVADATTFLKDALKAARASERMANTKWHQAIGTDEQDILFRAYVDKQKNAHELMLDLAAVIGRDAALAYNAGL